MKNLFDVIAEIKIPNKDKTVLDYFGSKPFLYKLPSGTIPASEYEDRMQLKDKFNLVAQETIKNIEFKRELRKLTLEYCEDVEKLWYKYFDEKVEYYLGKDYDKEKLFN